MSQKWKGRLVQRVDEHGNKSYIGTVSIAGFPYKMTVTRDWLGDEFALAVSVMMDEGKK